MNTSVPDIAEMEHEEYANRLPLNRLNGTGVQSIGIGCSMLVWDDEAKALFSKSDM